MKKFIVKKDNRRITSYSDLQKIENKFGLKIPNTLKNFGSMLNRVGKSNFVDIYEMLPTYQQNQKQ